MKKILGTLTIAGLLASGAFADYPTDGCDYEYREKQSQWKSKKSYQCDDADCYDDDWSSEFFGDVVDSVDDDWIADCLGYFCVEFGYFGLVQDSDAVSDEQFVQYGVLVQDVCTFFSYYISDIEFFVESFGGKLSGLIFCVSDTYSFFGQVDTLFLFCKKPCTDSCLGWLCGLSLGRHVTRSNECWNFDSDIIFDSNFSNILHKCLYDLLDDFFSFGCLYIVGDIIFARTSIDSTYDGYNCWYNDDKKCSSSIFSNGHCVRCKIVFHQVLLV